MNEQRDYTAELPRIPPEGMLEWLQKQGLLKSHLLIYKAGFYHEVMTGEKVPAVKVRCSACGGSWTAQKVDMATRYGWVKFGFWGDVEDHPVGDGEEAVCPLCGAQARVAHVSQIRHGRTVDDEGWPVSVHRIGNRLALVQWYVGKYVDKDAKETIFGSPYEAAVIEEDKMVRLTSYEKCMSVVSFRGEWKQRKRFYDSIGAVGLVYPWDTKLLEGSTAENSKLDKYLEAAGAMCPASYLRLWQKHRNVENLIQQGSGRLVGEMIASEIKRYSYEAPKPCPKLEGIHWKEVRPSKMLGMTGEEYAEAVRMNWSMEDWRLYTKAKEHGIKFNLPADLELCRKVGQIWCMKLIDEHVPLIRTARYAVQQKERNSRASPIEIMDYWRMARKLNYDMTDTHVLFPKDLMVAHDRLVGEMEEAEKKREAEEDARLAARFLEVAENLQKMAWTCDGILIRPAESPEELEREGKTLNHCVATYKKIHAMGEHCIFFIRQEEAPDVPWYTLELNVKDKSVIQNRGKHNCERTPAVRAFESAWLEYIRKGA